MASLSERHKSGETKVTSTLATIQVQLKAPKDQNNSFGGYKYRNAESIIHAFKEIAPDGVSLIMSDQITIVGERLFLIATAELREGNEVIATTTGAAMHALAKKGMDDAQITGACSSYARKYALCGLFAIDDSADDPDSKDNSKNQKEPEQPKTRDPVAIRDSLLAAIKKNGVKAKDNAKFQSAHNWLIENDPPKGGEITKALTDAENAQGDF
jgi:hypothetical protein